MKAMLAVAGFCFNTCILGFSIRETNYNTGQTYIGGEKQRRL